MKGSGGGAASDESAAGAVAEAVAASLPKNLPIGNILKKVAVTLCILVEKNELAVKENHKLNHESIKGGLEELEDLVEKLGRHYKVLNKVTHEKEATLDIQATSIKMLREHMQTLEGEKEKSEKDVASLKKVIQSLEKKIQEMKQSRKLQRTVFFMLYQLIYKC